MKSKYPHIFEPMTIRRMTVKNRIVMTPMGTNYGEQNGEMSFLHINYYEQRAKGGTGLLIVENASVDSPQGSNGTTQLRIDLDNYIPRLFKLCENVHKHGACIAIQLNHAGASAMSSRIGMQPVSASDVPSKAGGEIPRPLEKDEIMHIVKKYGEAAKRAQICGFDAVEIHAGHSYLISQFLSPTTNKRTDEFGGSPENRARFAKLVIEEVRKQVGPFFPIFVRISADEMVEGGNALEDTDQNATVEVDPRELVSWKVYFVDEENRQIQLSAMRSGTILEGEELVIPYANSLIVNGHRWLANEDSPYRVNVYGPGEKIIYITYSDEGSVGDVDDPEASERERFEMYLERAKKADAAIVGKEAEEILDDQIICESNAKCSYRLRSLSTQIKNTAALLFM